MIDLTKPIRHKLFPEAEDEFKVLTIFSKYAAISMNGGRPALYTFDEANRVFENIPEPEMYVNVYKDKYGLLSPSGIYDEPGAAKRFGSRHPCYPPPYLGTYKLVKVEP